MIVKFNESSSFLYAKELVESLRNLCLNMRDSDITYFIKPENDIEIKILGLVMISNLLFIEKTMNFYVNIIPHRPEDTKISKKEKTEVILETTENIERLMISEGLYCKYQLTYMYSLDDSRFGNSKTCDNITKDSFETESYLRDKVFGPNINPLISIRITFHKS